MSLLKISEILWLFVDTLTADDKYSLRNSENLRQPIQLHLSKTQKSFSNFSFISFFFFHHILSSLREKWSYKMSLLMTSEILGIFVNTLTAVEKYSLHNGENLRHPIQMYLSKKQKCFFKFFALLWNVHQILNSLKRKMSLIVYIFPKLRTVKDVIR